MLEQLNTKNQIEQVEGQSGVTTKGGTSTNRLENPALSETSADASAPSLPFREQVLHNLVEKIKRMRADQELAVKIDTWLAQRGSPMVGCGKYYVENSKRTGIPACLPVGIAEAESSSGAVCFAPHNAFGMLAYPNGWPSWEEAITANFDWLVHYYGCPQSMYDCPGYCQGNGTMATVEQVQRHIEGMEI